MLFGANEPLSCHSHIQCRMRSIGHDINMVEMFSEVHNSMNPKKGFHYKKKSLFYQNPPKGFCPYPIRPLHSATLRLRWHGRRWGDRGVLDTKEELHSVQRRYRISLLKRRWEKYEYSRRTFYAELEPGALVMSSEHRVFRCEPRHLLVMILPKSKKTKTLSLGISRDEILLCNNTIDGCVCKEIACIGY